MQITKLTPNRVRELRLKAGLTQEGLAREAEVSLATIQKIESGRTIPRSDTARRIARAVRASVDKAFPEEVAS